MLLLALEKQGRISIDYFLQEIENIFPSLVYEILGSKRTQNGLKELESAADVCLYNTSSSFPHISLLLFLSESMETSEMFSFLFCFCFNTLFD